MSKQNKKSKKAIFFQKTALFGLFFLAFFIFFISSGEKAKADDGYKGTCMETNGYIKSAIGFKYKYYENESSEECNNRCANNSTKCYWTSKKLSILDNLTQTSTMAAAEETIDYSCEFLKTPATCLLSPTLWFVRVLLLGSVTFFTWVIKVENLKLVLEGGGIVYKIWMNVRDLLNMAFILVLLFSAFCTIFQVPKYNYKKILLTLVIMALLVNFSYPIARVIIDASNVMMYSIYNMYFGSDTGLFFSTKMVSSSGIGTLLQIKNYPNAGMLLASVVFLFIFAVTLFAFAILLFVRMMALAILIIFSPIGFVGNIMPGFESYASKWWDNLFRYAFFGPIMMFGLYISIEMMTAVNGLGDFKAAAENIKSGADSNLIGTLAFLMIPNIILWMTMGLAQSMSIAGASTVMGGAQKALRWSGKTLSGYRLGKALGGAGAHWANRKLAETPGLRYLSPMAMKDAWKKRTERADRKATAYSSGIIQDRLNKVIGTMASANPFIGVKRFIKGRQAEKAGFVDKATGRKMSGWQNVFHPMDNDKTDYAFIEQRRWALEEAKRLRDTNDNAGYILDESAQARIRNEAGDAGIVMAGHGILASKNDFNVFADRKGIIDTDPQQVKTELIKEHLEVGIKDTQNIAKSLMATGESNFNAGGFGYGGMGEFIERGTKDDRPDINYKNFRTVEELQQLQKINKDIKSKAKISNPQFNKPFQKSGFYFTTEDSQAKIGAAKFGNMQGQARQRITHPDSYYLMDNEGVVKGIHLEGEKIFNMINDGDVDNVITARDSLQRHWQACNMYHKNKDFQAQIDKLPNAKMVKKLLERSWRIIEGIDKAKGKEAEWHETNRSAKPGNV